MNDEIFEPDAIDFYDWNELERLQEKRDKKFLKLLSKAKDGDQKQKNLCENTRQKGRFLRPKQP